jgi:heme oxygenase
VRGIVTPDLLQEPNLRADLHFFGVDAASIEPRSPVKSLVAAFEESRISRPTAFFGSYYVLEGSKNGARFIARAVMPAYGLTPGNGTRYLDPHGEQQRPLWQAFRERMDAAGFTGDEAEEIVRAASAMFRAIRELDDDIWHTTCLRESNTVGSLSETGRDGIE